MAILLEFYNLYVIGNYLQFLAFPTIIEPLRLFSAAPFQIFSLLLRSTNFSQFKG